MGVTCVADSGARLWWCRWWLASFGSGGLQWICADGGRAGTFPRWVGHKERTPGWAFNARGGCTFGAAVGLPGHGPFFMSASWIVLGLHVDVCNVGDLSL
mmetsp:Transcript_40309/g.100267  ORF Transcript_40309/g.100267 Transcript_40309/m.100267 type:complete len:100 (+) Transcript_40309:940-1239(+)